MNLMFRFIRFLLLLALDLLRFLTPLFIRFLLFPVLLIMLRLLRDMALLALATAVIGPTQYMDRLAGQWAQRLIEVENDRQHIIQIYLFCRWMAGAVILMDWLILVLFTVQILRVVYWLFT